MPQLVGRKLPIRYFAVKKSTFGVACLAFLGACGPIVQRAPFPQRPDSVKDGSVIGPFEGRVLNTDTDQPIADALVWCSWAFERGVGNSAAETVRTAFTLTDADGRYRLRPLRRFPQGLSTRLATFSLIVYKKGFVAYRHDRVFNQKRRRRTFAQLANEVRLSRWSPELSHAEHLLFIGVAPPLRKASQWEVPLAAAELAGQRTRPALVPSMAPPMPPQGDRKLLDASNLLSSDDVRSITGYTGAFRQGRLAGERSGTYDTFHLRALDRPERYDVAVRLWRAPESALTEKYEEVLNKLPGSKQKDEVGDRSFSVQQGEILGLGFLERAHSVVVLVTCGHGQCTKPDHLLKLARKVEKNLSKLKLAQPVGPQRQPATKPAPDTEDDEE